MQDWSSGSHRIEANDADADACRGAVRWSPSKSLWMTSMTGVALVVAPQTFSAEALAVLPPEADDELCIPAMSRDINFIRLATPTTDEKRLPAVLANTRRAGIIESSSGRATVTPRPRSAVRREMDFPVRNITLLPRGHPSRRTLLADPYCPAAAAGSASAV